jgi:hypothetical protein
MIYRKGPAGREHVPVASDEFECRIIDGQAAVTIGGGNANDTYLVGFWAFTNLTGNLVIDGFKKKSSSAEASKQITIATPTAGFYDFKGILNDDSGLQITLANAADDEDVMIIYKRAL